MSHRRRQGRRGAKRSSRLLAVAIAVWLFAWGPAPSPMRTWLLWAIPYAFAAVAALWLVRFALKCNRRFNRSAKPIISSAAA